jgi:hypothetical protein
MKIAGRSRKRKANFRSRPFTLSDAKTIPMRPPGYFANVYSKAEIQEDNLLAKASVVRVFPH